MNGEETRGGTIYIHEKVLDKPILTALDVSLVEGFSNITSWRRLKGAQGILGYLIHIIDTNGGEGFISVLDEEMDLPAETLLAKLSPEKLEELMKTDQYAGYAKIEDKDKDGKEAKKAARKAITTHREELIKRVFQRTKEHNDNEYAERIQRIKQDLPPLPSEIIENPYYFDAISKVNLD